jgi:putative intracellular protease/amidase/DNA-directed RNA polymerase subunit RPC12/RpoP
LGIVVPLHCWFRHSFAEKNNYMKTLFYSLLLTTLVTVTALPALAQAKTAYYCPPCGQTCDNIAFAKPGKCPQCGMDLVLETVEAHEQKAEKPLKVLLYLQDGVEILDFAGPMEVFAAAGFDVSTVSKTKNQIISQGILKITPDYSIDDAPNADMVVFFGGNSGVAANDPAVIEWLKNKITPQYYVSVCSGAFVLGKAGLLDNLTVTTFHDNIENLKKAVPKAKVLSNVRFVDNGRVITTAGVSAGIDGALHIVSRLKGVAAAVEVAKYMEYDNWVPEKGLVISHNAVSK